MNKHNIINNVLIIDHRENKSMCWIVLVFTFYVMSRICKFIKKMFRSDLLEKETPMNTFAARGGNANTLLDLFKSNSSSMTRLALNLTPFTKGLLSIA